MPRYPYPWSQHEPTSGLEGIIHASDPDERFGLAIQMTELLLVSKFMICNPKFVAGQKGKGENMTTTKVLYYFQEFMDNRTST